MNHRELLESVSRSFALSLVWLPRRERSVVGLSYLLARFADTLTDSGSWSLEERLSHLERLENAILQNTPGIWRLTSSIDHFTPAETALLAKGGALLSAFQDSPDRNREFGCQLLGTLIGAMKWDLTTFGRASESSPVMGINDYQEFDKYCYCIAGCVGKFWVQTFELPSYLESLAISYGKGLQRINILRDVCEDWKRGRIYFPGNLLEIFDLLGGEPWKRPRWPDFCQAYIKEAHELLFQGASFCDALARYRLRLRFSSVMPLMIGFKTLDALQNADSWNNRIKISRREVRGLGILAALKVFFGLSITPWARKFTK